MAHSTRTIEDEISYAIIGATIEVHKTLGEPGLLEVVYERALAWELQQRGLKVECQKVIPILYKVSTWMASSELTCWSMMRL